MECKLIHMEFLCHTLLTCAQPHISTQHFSTQALSTHHPLRLKIHLCTKFENTNSFTCSSSTKLVPRPGAWEGSGSMFHTPHTHPTHHPRTSCHSSTVHCQLIGAIGL